LRTRDLDAAAKTALEAQQIAGKEAAAVVSIDIRDREGIHKAFREVIAMYGGIDVLINTAAVFPSSPDGVIQDEQWVTTLDINVTANHRLADETRQNSVRAESGWEHCADKFCQRGGGEAR